KRRAPCWQTAGCTPMPTALSSSRRLPPVTMCRPKPLLWATAPTTCWCFWPRHFCSPVRQWSFRSTSFRSSPLLAGWLARVSRCDSVGAHARLAVVANPNIPTGAWRDGERLKDFIGSLPPHVICVVDEAYTEYAESDRLGDAPAWLEEFPNLVVTRTFSKAYGLAGLRVGYALSNPGIADLLNRVRPAFNVNAPALAAAQAALEDTAFIEKTRQMNSEGKKQLEAGLKKLGVTTIPSATNFLLAGFDRPGAELNEALLQRGIIVRPVANYDLDNHLRITIGTRSQNER